MSHFLTYCFVNTVNVWMVCCRVSMRVMCIECICWCTIRMKPDPPSTRWSTTAKYVDCDLWSYNYYLYFICMSICYVHVVSCRVVSCHVLFLMTLPCDWISHTFYSLWSTASSEISSDTNQAAHIEFPSTSDTQFATARCVVSTSLSAVFSSACTCYHGWIQRCHVSTIDSC